MITSREELKQYCLRRLGSPVVEINVDDDQVEDRIDEAFQFYREFHFDAVEKVYAKQQLLPSNVTVTANATSFTVSDIITGSTSGASATVYALPNVTTIQVYDINGTFTNGETVTGSQSGQTATLAATSAVVKGNYDNRYISLPESIISVERIVQLTNKSNGISMFDVRYQLMLNNIQSLTNTDIIYYAQLKTHLNLINDLMTGQKPIRFNRHMNRLYIDMAWSEDVEVGDYVIVEGWQTLDPNEFTDVYNDYFLKKYTTQLIKQQWGTNLKKFEGVQLPGGVTLNGQIIYQEATDEIEKLRDEAQNTYQLPTDFFTG